MRGKFFRGGDRNASAFVTRMFYLENCKLGMYSGDSPRTSRKLGVNEYTGWPGGERDKTTCLGDESS